MARGVNKVILIGYLGREPVIRYTPSGTAVANIGIATTSAWKDRQSGELRESTEWHRAVLFNRLAEVAGEYLKKGNQVYIEGRLRSRRWRDGNGQDRWTTEIIVGELLMPGGREPGSGGLDGHDPPPPDIDDAGFEHDIPF